ncbi:MAG: hypothetical protein QM499_09815 [Flavobacteriaceae bacterium]
MNISSVINFKTLCVLFIISYNVTIAQVGINTTTPNGILDISSSTTGFVLPRVSLTSTILQAPVVNPKTGVSIIPEGTTVYNTNTSSSGTNDVSPGMYVWDGSKWVIEFSRTQATFFESDLFIRTKSSDSFIDIPGLSSKNFTANYTGKYKVEVRVNFAGGSAKVPNISGGSASSQSDGYLNIARAFGIFRFNFNGTDFDIPAHAYSTAYEPSVSATNYFAIWQEFSTVQYIFLTAGDVVNFNLSFDQHDAPEYEDNGSSNDGRGHIAYDIPCTVEIVYIGD